MKKAIRAILDFLSYSNIFVGLCAFVFSYKAIFICGEDFPERVTNYYPYLFSLSVFFVYGLQRFVEAGQIAVSSKFPKQAPIAGRFFWILERRKLLAGLIVISAIAIIFMIFYIDGKLVLYFFPLLLISIFYYAGPFPLKTLPGMKSFFISFVWVTAAYIVPCLDGGKKIDFHLWMHIAGQFFLLNAICIPFDIRDYKVDKIKPMKKQVKSLPVVFGVNGSKVIGVVMVLMYFLLAGVVAYFNTGIEKMFVFASLLTSVYVIIIILTSKEERSNYFYAFLADGGLILQALFLVVCFRICLPVG